MTGSKLPRKSRWILPAALLAALCLVGLFLLHYIHRQRLNHALILAIDALDEERALALLRAGADGAATHADAVNVSNFDLVRRLFGPASHTTAGASGDRADQSALLDYYSRAAAREQEARPAASSSALDERLPLALLSAGAPCSAVGDDGPLSLYFAALLRHHTAVQRILGLGVNANTITNSHHNTVLMAADAEDAGVLLDHGASVDLANEDGNTALFGADALKAVALLNRNARIEQINREGQTPLIYNSASGDDDSVLVLIARRANVTAKDVHGTTALLAAAAHCRLETIKALLRAGANLHDTKTDGTTTLMYSILNPDDRVSFWLLKQGVEVNVRGMGNNTALSIAEQRRRQAKDSGQPTERCDAIIRELRHHGAH